MDATNIPEIEELAKKFYRISLENKTIDPSDAYIDIVECFAAVLKKNMPAKKTRPENAYHTVFDMWFRMLTEGPPYEMKKKDWVGIAQIKKYCEEHCKEGEPLDSFAAILRHYRRLPKYYQENRNPCFIGSRLPEIISLLKTPAKDHGKVSTAAMLNESEKKKAGSAQDLKRLR